MNTKLSKGLIAVVAVAGSVVVQPGKASAGYNAGGYNCTGGKKLNTWSGYIPNHIHTASGGGWAYGSSQTLSVRWTYASSSGTWTIETGGDPGYISAWCS